MIVAAVAFFGPPQTASAAGDNKSGSEAEAGGQFVSGFEDLPLMPGLVQIKDAGTVFDTPSGRIIEAYADGQVTPTDVASFYARTLPQLGWRQVSQNRYRREGEVLDLEITPGSGPGGGGNAARTKVRFYLAPG